MFLLLLSCTNDSHGYCSTFLFFWLQPSPHFLALIMYINTLMVLLGLDMDVLRAVIDSCDGTGDVRHYVLFLNGGPLIFAFCFSQYLSLTSTSCT